jgi:transposase
MDVLIARRAGPDVHKKTVVACLRCVGPDGTAVEETRTFSTMTDDLLALADWLAGAGATHAAMESTGVYWEPVWHSLEGRLDLTPVNARHMRQVPGRKADVKDAAWIAQLLAHGLLSRSFVPPAPIRTPRDLTRQRAQLVADKAAVADRVQKALEDADIKSAGVATDVLGASGRAMIARMIAGEDDPSRLAAEARASLKRKIIPLRGASQGRVTEGHRFMLRLQMDQVRHPEALIARLDARIAEVMGPLAEAAARSETIPGMGTRAAEVILAEIGGDMAQFPTAGHLASWAGFCPGNNQSAGKRRTGRTTKGSVWLRATLVQVAWSASHTKRTILAASYRSLAKRLGKKKAPVALGHKVLRIIYEMLSRGTDYVERLDPGLAA